MDERAWLSARGPAGMLVFFYGRASARKLRLYACACCHHIDRHLNAQTRAVLATAERFADGLASEGARVLARESVEDATRMREVLRGAPAVSCTVATDAVEAAFEVGVHVVHALIWHAGIWGTPNEAAIRFSEEVAQAQLLRDIIGNPFRPVAFAPDWRTSDAVALARTMYEAREFSAMPILADALQDAGCDSDEVLNHCRDARPPHVRGCWVVDAVLGKE